jgi:hypothetical protein
VLRGARFEFVDRGGDGDVFDRDVGKPRTAASTAANVIGSVPSGV